MINFYSYWLGNEEQKKKIEEYFSKIEKLNKNIKFHLGPTKEEHEYLLEKFKFYSMNFKRKKFAFCSDIWRLYKMLVLGNNENQEKNIYIDSKTLFNEERLNELVSLIENNNNILIKEKPHRIWNGFIYLCVFLLKRFHWNRISFADLIFFSLFGLLFKYGAHILY